MNNKGTRDEGQGTRGKRKFSANPSSVIILSHCHIVIFALLSLLLSSCNNEYTAKPKAYPRVEYPERKYDLYDPATCPFKFEKPTYAKVKVDSVYFGDRQVPPCWLNIDFPAFNGTINLTYKEINADQKLEKLVEDAHKMSYKHTKKADYINEVVIENKHGVGGLLYDVGGDAASNVQFFLTDTNHHFIRGALYFNNTPNADSMAPVISYVKEDLKHILQTFEWK